MADGHFHVSKKEKEGRTLTQVSSLSTAQRQEEIARMLGGETVTPAIRKAAAELLKPGRPKR